MIADETIWQKLSKKHMMKLKQPIQRKAVHTSGTKMIYFQFMVKHRSNYTNLLNQSYNFIEVLSNLAVHPLVHDEEDDDEKEDCDTECCESSTTRLSRLRDLFSSDCEVRGNSLFELTRSACVNPDNNVR